jgi:hypothetical protein
VFGLYRAFLRIIFYDDRVKRDRVKNDSAKSDKAKRIKSSDRIEKSSTIIK